MSNGPLSFIFYLKNLDCVSCADKIEKSLKSQNYVISFKLEFILEKVIVELRSESYKTELVKLFNSIGFPVIDSYKESKVKENTRKIIVYSKEGLYIQEILVNKYGIHDIIIHQNNQVEIIYSPSEIKSMFILKLLDNNQVDYSYKNKMTQHLEAIDNDSNDFNYNAFLLCLFFTVLNFSHNFIIYGSLKDFLLDKFIFHDKMPLYLFITLLINIPIIKLYGMKTYVGTIRTYYLTKATGTDTLITFGSLSSIVLTFISVYELICISNLKQYNDVVLELCENLSASAAVVAIFSLGKFIESHAKNQLKQKASNFMSKKNNGLLLSKSKSTLIDFSTGKETILDPGLIETEDYVSLKKGDLLLFDVIVMKGKVEVNEGFNHGFDILNIKEPGDKIKSGTEIIKVIDTKYIEQLDDNTHNNHNTKPHIHTSNCSHDHHSHSHQDHSKHEHKHKNESKLDNKCIVKVEQPIENCMILKLTEEMAKSTSQKLKFEYLIEKIVKYFVPVIIIISISTSLIWLYIKLVHNADISYIYITERSISILVVSCPCAFGLAIPIVTTTMLKIALEYGILIKNLSALPDIKNTTKVFFDKTGTLTEPIEDINVIYSKHGADSFIYNCIEEIEKSQTHPVGEALYKFSFRNKNKNIVVKMNNKPINHFNGVSGEIIFEDKVVNVSLGNLSFIENNYPEIAITEDVLFMINNSKSKGLSVIIVMMNSSISMILALNTSSNIRNESYVVLENLQKTKNCYLLSGDIKESVESLGSKLKIKKENIYSEQSAQSKKEILISQKSKNDKIMMIGDGINDVLSLSTSDFGISFNANSQLNLISGDVTIIKEDLSLILVLFEISKYTSIFIYMNIFWAFFYNIIMIPFTTGFLQAYIDIEISPSVSSLMQLLSDFLIVLSASLLKCINYDKQGLITKKSYEYKELKNTDKEELIVEESSLSTSIELVTV